MGSLYKDNFYVLSAVMILSTFGIVLERKTQIGKALSVCSPFGHKILNNTREIYLVLDDQVAVSNNITTNSMLILLCTSYPIQPKVKTIFHQAINNLQVFI